MTTITKSIYIGDGRFNEAQIELIGEFDPLLPCAWCADYPIVLITKLSCHIKCNNPCCAATPSVIINHLPNATGMNLSPRDVLPSAEELYAQVVLKWNTRVMPIQKGQIA